MSNKFCPNCSKNMIRSISSDLVEFVCSCGTTINGNDYDVLVKSFTIDIENKSSEKSSELIKNSARDRTTERVAIPCTKCHRKYQSRIRDGNSIHITCICNK